MVQHHLSLHVGLLGATIGQLSMRHLQASAAAIFLFGFAAPLIAAAPYPSVEQATFHQLLFANPDVAVLKNVYPPHSDSGYHVHSRELFYVVIEPARFGAQKLGQALKTPPMTPVGGTGYNVMTAEPFVHRVVNSDRRACHIVAIELRRAVPGGSPLSARPSDYVQIFDNQRMRAWRLIVAPGQSVPAMTQSAVGVRVVVRGGSLVTSMPGVADQVLAIQNGDVSMQLEGTARALRNAGRTPIELVEIELK
ncbi:MAG: hypothetical protein ABIO29_05675 [Sphingomicrobium sp.]